MRTFLYVKETQEIISKHCSIKAAQRQQSIMPIDGNKYEIIPQFLGGRDWKQSMPSVGTQTSPSIQSILDKYPPQG